MSDLSLLAVFLSLSLCVGADTTSCYFHRLRGIIKDELHLSSFAARSDTDCVRSSCGCQPLCAASFNPVTKQCWKALFGSLLDPHQFVLVNRSDPWVTFIITIPEEPPSALWLFDDVNKGSNLGTKGGPLNMSIDGLVWNTVGPRGTASVRKYPRYVGPGIPSIQLEHSGSYALTFTGPYTVTFWVKTDNVDATIPVLEAYPIGAIDLWFYPSNQRDQLCLSPAYPNHVYKTVRNATDNDKWRHVALVYRAVGAVRFYLNGSVWQHTATTTSSEVKQPTKLCLFKHCGTQKSLKGSMACLAIFDKALTQKEVLFVMKACP